MTILLAIKVLLCAAIATRVLLYQRNGSVHRPVAAAIAYLLIIAAAWLAIDAGYALASGHGDTNLAELFVLGILLAALTASRGNVVALFWTGDHGRLYQFIGWHRRHVE